MVHGKEDSTRHSRLNQGATDLEGFFFHSISHHFYFKIAVLAEVSSGRPMCSDQIGTDPRTSVPEPVSEVH